MADPHGTEDNRPAADPAALAGGDEPVSTESLREVVTEPSSNLEAEAEDFAYEKSPLDEKNQHEHRESKLTSSSSSHIGAGRDDTSSQLSRELSRTISGKTLSKVESKPLMNPDHRWYHYLLFKTRHLPPVPKQREVSREYRAHWFSQLTFNWITTLMTTGYQRTLELNDIWLVNPDRSAEVMSRRLMDSFERRVARGDDKPLLGAMHETFKFEFWLGGACNLVASVVQIINPFILRFLIQFADDAFYAQFSHAPSPPIGRGIGLVFCVTILQFIQSTCTNQFLYRGMMNGGQARAALISLIFDKSLRISGRAKAGGRADPLDTPLPSPPLNSLKPGSKEEKHWFRKKLNPLSKGKKGGKDKPFDDSGWSNGRIINLMSVDTYRIDQASGMFHMIWTSPIAIVITLVLLLINITYSALAGFGLLVIAMPILGKSIGSLFRRRKAINKVTDQRVSLTQEILTSVRFVKYFGWETSFLERINNIRTREIRSIQVLLAIRNGINAISMTMPTFASMLAFITYALSNHVLNPAYIFSSLALFNSIRLPMNLLPLVIGQVVDAASSVNRIQEFLLAEEGKEECAWDMQAKNAVDVKAATFTWEQTRAKEGGEKDAVNASKTVKQEKEEKKAAKAAKKDKNGSALTGNDTPPEISTEKEERMRPFEIKDLTFTVGRDELIAVIGEVGSGKSSLLSALAGDMRKTAGSATLGATRAFCPQYAWIQNASLRENILFGKPMQKDWYDSVIQACALQPDLDMLPAGDATEIGERGITVSGGQKQRLNIARAIYFNSDLVLLDDPLSAVDAHVGRHIMDNAICGLLRHKCRILATHQLWVLHRCDRIIWMKDGHISTIGTFDDLMANDSEFKELIANNAQEEKQKQTEKKVDGDEIAEDKKEQKKKQAKKPAAALMQVEDRAVRSVSWGVYSAYVKAAGSLWVLPLILGLLILSQGAQISSSLWLSYWTSNRFNLSVGQYIGIYAGLGGMQALLIFLFSVALSVFGTEASRVMLNRAITRVLRAPMSFFDTTPLGRITNRFSKDVDTMDNTLTDAIRMFTITAAMIISVFILIIAYYYYFAVALVPLMFLFLFSGSFYRASAREVKRHEAVLRSTVFARFSEAVSGVATIRAYGLQSRFSTSIRDAVDDMDSAYYMTFANQRWLSVRLDVIGNLLVFVVGILVVTSRFHVNPSTGGLVLSYILSIVQMIQFTVRQLAEVENNMNATERVHHYGTALEEEPPLHLRDVPDSWPNAGDIVFDNVQMRYRAGLPLVLRGLSMHVRGGERIGVVGRTGAGKSSIMSTLFRLVELSGGSIKIDGIDISTVGLADLRSRLSIIPQDPTLFRGTVRSNLDPFGRYSDLELWSALRQADLVGQDTPTEGADPDSSAAADIHAPAKTGRIHLDSAVDEEGLNFSLGQRQLMALARALVRNSQIIVCDEATSSVDMATDDRIQRAIRKGFRGKTLLCIAHRLKTIIHYDRIVVMDDGRIAELDSPRALYERAGGIFRGMCERSKIRREDFDMPDSAPSSPALGPLEVEDGAALPEAGARGAEGEA